jgi:transcription initiation factor TFIID subunit 7
MMNDINNKAVARQVLVDEVERAKPVAEPVTEDVEMPAASGGAAAEPAAFSDEEDDLFGEEEEDDVGAEEEVTGPDTPRSQYVDMEPDSPAIMGPSAEEDVQTDGEEQLAEGAEEYGEGEEDDEEDEEDENDEMAAMLAAELGGQAEVQDQTDAMEAIDAMVLEDDLEKLQGGDGMMPSSPAMDQYAPDFSTREGGVGMRRLVEGAEEDDSGDSEDSDD